MSAAVSYSFSPTTTVESAKVNQNFTDLVNYINNTACVTGMVTMWSGDIGSIPTGWTLDNNLKDKFIIGAGNTYAIGDTGGSATKDISHTHTGTTDSYSLYGPGTHAPRSINDVNETGYQHNHTFTSASGGSATQDVMPPFYALAFIKKT